MRRLPGKMVRMYRYSLFTAAQFLRRWFSGLTQTVTQTRNLERKAPEDKFFRLPEQFWQAVCAFLFIFCRYPTLAMKPLIFCAASFFMPAVTWVYDQPRDPELFRFEPIPLSFEPVEPGRCAPVLYSSAVRDMIDYSLRSCVERGVTVRRCKNCGRWFPQTGRVSAEYCERPVKYGEQRCREIGAFRQWTKKQTDDPIFKAYRKEYKKRFAWIKAGRITDEQFYAWSEQAREEKKKCDREIISLEEFQQWLRDSKI